MGKVNIRSAAYAKRLDAADPLRSYRGQFQLPKGPNGKTGIYFLGHSLGAQPRPTRAAVLKVLDRWGDAGLRSFFTHGPAGERPWLDYYGHATELMAPIIGAKPSEVGLMAGLTINLHLMLTPFYAPTPRRYKILLSSLAFPSDRYGTESHVNARALQLRSYLGTVGLDPKEAIVWVKPRRGTMVLDPDDILDAIEQHGQSLAVVLLENPGYLNGQVLDMRPIVRAAHKVGARVGNDLAHGAGNIRPDLHDNDIDFAIWCNYKYLNSSPGTIAGYFIHERHHRRHDLAHLIGWFANRASTRFEMRHTIDRDSGANGFQNGTPSILLLSCLISSLEIFNAAGMKAIGEKRDHLTGYLLDLLADLEPEHLSIITPRDPRFRGAAVSMRIPKGGERLVEALAQLGIEADFRRPDIVRVAPTPLYNRYEEVRRFAEILRREFWAA